MKNKKLAFAVLGLLLTAAFALQGCIKDTVTRTYTYTLYRPVYKTTAEVRSNIKPNPSRQVSQPGKLFIRGQYIFLNEVEKGIHIIDNADPAHPRNIAFIDIPGNVDLAVKGNTLYADLYTDLVALDISDPLQTKVISISEDAFPHRMFYSRFYLDSTKIVVDWIKKDTTVTDEFFGGGWGMLEDGMGGGFFALASSNKAASSPMAAAPAGMGGSMARFSVVNQRLYTVGTSELKVFNITDPGHPAYVTQKNVGWNIETIYPFKDRLFIGSNNGMYIYSISNPDQPALLSQFSHVRSCDPVIADDTHAYVTLRSGTACQGFTNQMEVLNISNLTQPSLVKTYPMTNPHGLSKDGNLLFLCDGRDGLKVFNAANPGNIQLMKTIGGLETYDVIAYNGVAIVVAKDGLYQFDYTDTDNIRQLSKLTIGL